MVSPFFWGGRGGANLCRQLETTVEIRGGWDFQAYMRKIAFLPPNLGGWGGNKLVKSNFSDNLLEKQANKSNYIFRK